jgi:ABC-type antimicrobial peptide transport system permease subunit
LLCYSCIRRPVFHETLEDVLTFLLFRGLHSVLYGVKSTDLVTPESVSALLLAVGFAARFVPALHATRVDPVVALRDE